MKPAVAGGRVAYRVAHRLLRVYWFFARPEVDGVKCAITDGGKVLLVRHTYGRREWDLPGGGVKRDESALDAARREVEEELGVAVEGWDSLGAVKASPYHSRDTLHCFHAELHEPALTLDEIEIAAARWFPRTELPRDLGRHARNVLARLDAHGSDERSSRAAADRGASR